MQPESVAEPGTELLIAERCFRERRYALAIEHFRRVLPSCSPKLPVLLRLAESCKALRRYLDAADYYCAAIDSEPEETALYLPAVGLLEKTDQLDRASALVERGLERSPGHADLTYLQGKLLARRGRLAAAAHCYRKAIESSPDPAALHFILSEYALLLERQQQYEAAMATAVRAQRIAARAPGVAAVDGRLSIDFIEKTRRWLQDRDRIDWQFDEDSGRKAPVFLAGFPRSGTTLMEEVLNAHPALTVSDELPVFQAKVHYLAQILDKPVQYPNDLDRLSAADIARFRKEYFAGMDRGMAASDPQARIVDKFPASFYYLAAIRRFFPESPIVMMIRDPRDVCLSCFFQAFAANPDTVQFFSLESTARYYARSMSLYRQLRDTLDLKLVELRYEDLCTDFEASVRLIVGHAGEDWDERVLSYREYSRDFIQTPSHAAVREPLHTKAIGKWQHYEKDMGPILEILQPFVDEFGYGEQ